VGTEGPLSIRACQALRPGAPGTFDVHSVDQEATLSLALRAVLPWVLASGYRDLPGRLGQEGEKLTGLLTRHERCSSPARSGRPRADHEERVSTILVREPQLVDKGLPVDARDRVVARSGGVPLIRATTAGGWRWPPVVDEPVQLRVHDPV